MGKDGVGAMQTQSAPRDIPCYWSYKPPKIELMKASPQ